MFDILNVKYAPSEKISIDILPINCLKGLKPESTNPLSPNFPLKFVTCTLELFIGSMSIDIFSDGAYLTFRISNKTSFKSFFYQAPVPSWNRSTLPVMGNMSQVYTWKEKIYR